MTTTNLLFVIVIQTFAYINFVLDLILSYVENDIITFEMSTRRTYIHSSLLFVTSKYPHLIEKKNLQLRIKSYTKVAEHRTTVNILAKNVYLFHSLFFSRFLIIPCFSRTFILSYQCSAEGSDEKLGKIGKHEGKWGKIGKNREK